MPASATSLSVVSVQSLRTRADNFGVRLRNSVGSPVEGHNFYDREVEQARVWQRLETDNILLLAPRRVGKTSLLYKLEASAAQHGYRPVFVSVASHEHELAFLQALLEAVAMSTRFRRKVAGRARKLLARVKSINVDKLNVELGTPSWQALGDEVLHTLQISEQRCLVMIDELPIFVLTLLRSHGRERARSFLNWFRQVRQDRRARLSVRWLVCGSIGLDTVTQRERIGDTIGDLAILRLDAFSRAHARVFLAELARSYDLELQATAIEHMLDKVGWLIPYHLQVLFSLVRDLDLARPDIEAVERAYAEMLSNHHKGYFDPWVQRLRDELGSTDEGHALALLEVAALDPSGAPGSVVYGLMHSRGVELEHTRYLLGVLVNDGYLVVVDGRWQFRSPLLRDYWRTMVTP